MCNTLPVRRFKIPKDGVGYKIFAKMDSGRYNTLYFGQHRYERDSSGWIRWNDDEEESGFCFFLKEEDAQTYAYYVQARRKITSEERDTGAYAIVIRKIEYSDGLGEFVSAMDHRATMALCRAFKILKEK